jgi:hypothetical protein
MALTGFDKMPSSRMGTSTRFALTTASQATAVFSAQCRQIRVATSTNASTFVYVKIGDGTPSADSTGSAGMGANVIDYFQVTPGQKCAVSADSAGGFVTVTEMS